MGKCLSFTVLLTYWSDFYASLFEKQSKVYQSWNGYPGGKLKKKAKGFFGAFFTKEGQNADHARASKD